MSSNFIKPSFIEELQDKAILSDIIGRYIKLENAGSRKFKACCPFHSEKTPSFHIDDERAVYHCFGCGAKGNALSFLRDYNGLNFKDSVIELANLVGLPVEYEEDNRTREEQEREQARKQSLQLDQQTITEVADFYHQQLLQTQHAVDYLVNRGLTQEMANLYYLGYAPGNNAVMHYYNHLVKNGLAKISDPLTHLINVDILRHSNNGEGYYDTYRERIIFPIFNLQGQIVGFGGRILTNEKDKAKYINPSNSSTLYDKSKELYGLYQVVKSHRDSRKKIKRVILVEGYLDVISLSQFGIYEGVAASGTAISTGQLQQIFKYTQNLVCCFDGDAAGYKAAAQAARNVLSILQDEHIVQFAFLTDGEDPDSYLKKYGSQAYDDFLKQKSVGLIDYLIEHTLETLTEQKVAASDLERLALAQLGEYYAQIKARAYRSDLVNKLIRRFNLDYNALIAQFEQIQVSYEEQQKREQERAASRATSVSERTSSYAGTSSTFTNAYTGSSTPKGKGYQTDARSSYTPKANQATGRYPASGARTIATNASQAGTFGSGSVGSQGGYSGASGTSGVAQTSGTAQQGQANAYYPHANNQVVSPQSQQGTAVAGTTNVAGQVGQAGQASKGTQDSQGGQAGQGARQAGSAVQATYARGGYQTRAGTGSSKRSKANSKITDLSLVRSYGQRPANSRVQALQEKLSTQFQQKRTSQRIERSIQETTNTEYTISHEHAFRELIANTYSPEERMQSQEVIIQQLWEKLKDQATQNINFRLRRQRTALASGREIKDPLVFNEETVKAEIMSIAKQIYAQSVAYGVPLPDYFKQLPATPRKLAKPEDDKLLLYPDDALQKLSPLEKEQIQQALLELKARYFTYYDYDTIYFHNLVVEIDKLLYADPGRLPLVQQYYEAARRFENRIITLLSWYHERPEVALHSLLSYITVFNLPCFTFFNHLHFDLLQIRDQEKDGELTSEQAQEEVRKTVRSNFKQYLSRYYGDFEDNLVSFNPEDAPYIFNKGMQETYINLIYQLTNLSQCFVQTFADYINNANVEMTFLQSLEYQLQHDLRRVQSQQPGKNEVEQANLERALQFMQDYEKLHMQQYSYIVSYINPPAPHAMAGYDLMDLGKYSAPLWSMLHPDTSMFEITSMRIKAINQSTLREKETMRALKIKESDDYQIELKQIRENQGNKDADAFKLHQADAVNISLSQLRADFNQATQAFTESKPEMQELAEVEQDNFATQKFQHLAEQAKQEAQAQEKEQEQAKTQELEQSQELALDYEQEQNLDQEQAAEQMQIADQTAEQVAQAPNQEEVYDGVEDFLASTPPPLELSTDDLNGFDLSYYVAYNQDEQANASLVNEQVALLDLEEAAPLEEITYSQADIEQFMQQQNEADE
ncbi:DNA primase [Psittacicella hinzii]|uniref:DNA primase n=1 Tax=Psittacicella hinzii TaxID=2028575 RepID=A0A3A1Y508_9GAMM|nr:DNA primase [Psittacicella hinzii]RIY32298.1 DNA primase [Psittacicella hinzii]